MDERTKKIVEMGIAELKAAYVSGEVLPSEACEAYLTFQRRVNPAINAVVAPREREARQEAALCDELLHKGVNHGALFGIPISIKESFHVQGMATTGGMTTTSDKPVSRSAASVLRLQEAGAVITCKTNTPELCFCQETDNNRWGVTSNPWNLDCTTGGSSGGEGALIAVGGAACGYGSDIGGSIRIPSHFNGVVGFKPAAFAFPEGGHLPEDSGERNIMDSMLGFGPMARSVDDAALVYGVTHPRFTYNEAPFESGDTPIISGAFAEYDLCPDTARRLGEAQRGLESLGHAVSHDGIPGLDEVPDLWQLVMSRLGVKDIKAAAYPSSPSGAVVDWLRAVTGVPTIHHPYLSWAIIGAELFYPSDRAWAKALVSIEALRESMMALLGAKGLFLTPVYPTTAKPHGDVYREIFAITRSFRRKLPFITLGNLLGLAAISVPCGFSSEGLPIGLQLLTRGGNEARLFAVARELETLFGGYRRATMYD